MPHLQYTPGIVGIVSKSGTLSYEAVGTTTRARLDQSLCIGGRGDLIPGTSLREGLKALLLDLNTKRIVLLGEIGGEAEIEAADYLKEFEKRNPSVRKPVVSMVTGKTAPRGRVMGTLAQLKGTARALRRNQIIRTSGSQDGSSPRRDRNCDEGDAREKRFVGNSCVGIT